MKWFAIALGLLLVAIGLFALAGGAFEVTQTTEILDIGPIEAHAKERDRVPLSPVLGVVGVFGGLVLMAVGGLAAHRAP